MEYPDPARKLSANLYGIYHCCAYSEKTPDNGRRNCPKHVEFHSENKFEKLVQLIGFIIREVQRIATEKVNYNHGHIHTKLLGSKPGLVAKYPSRRLPPAFRLTFFCLRKMSRAVAIIHSSQIRVLSRRHQTKLHLHICTSSFNMDLVPSIATQKWPTPLWFNN